MIWAVKSFDELTKEELYKIIRLRIEVFSVEQNCPYQDLDNFDQKAIHIMAWDGENLVAYSRVAMPGIIYEEACIGRVITAQSQRGKGLGKEIMERSIGFLENKNAMTIKIMAQTYLLDFYQNLGFVITSEEFLEDDLPHHYMVRKAS
ncbi:MAG: GNAT family N-acetyltransferase [Schleiferiaceae bacterium]